MYNPNFLSEHFDSPEGNFISNDFPGFMLPGLESFGPDILSKDFPSFPVLPEFESFDASSFMQYFDQALQSMPEEMKQFMSYPFDYVLPPGEAGDLQVTMSPSRQTFVYSKGKVGTLSQEERRLKVQKFLEKRKKRNFKKKISYMCRKKVADQRIRVKGRFVSKVQASALLEDPKLEE